MDQQIKKLQEIVDAALASVPPNNAEEVRFEVEMFCAKLHLIEQKSAGAPTIDKKRILGNLYEFLRDDLVYFLQKLLSNYREEFAAEMPGIVPSHRDVIFELKELQARVFYPVGKDFTKTSIIGRWFRTLNSRGHLTKQKVMNYFNVYKSRLYSLIDDKPFEFADYEALIRRMLFDQDYEVSFEEIYSAEMELRKEILFALLRTMSVQNRLDYLVSKEIVEEQSDFFIRVLHQQTANRLKDALFKMKELNQKILAEKKTVESEIQIAAKAQDRSIQKSLPEGDDLARFGLWYEPLMSVGGDFYNVRRISENEYSIFLADISGHGIGAAMFFNTVRLAFEACENYSDRPEKTLREMNQSLYGKLSENFVTAIYIYINLKKKIVKYANAAHPKAFLLERPDQKARVRFLRPTGKVLGIFRKVHFKEQSLPLSSAARLMVYTDGITEAVGSDGEMLGERGLFSIFREASGINTQDCLELMKKRILEFSGTLPREDDRSVIIADLLIE